ncbi:DUF262 domain-containing protein [Leptolyngbyaceae cyanobacterium CCMR0082]|uniref:DUF262 domain-containing protein n=1 Tax=Adonisia turfae CCMR0082 TaxID=2304604 RepID=A0A6M0S528_9CYAN|nr:DUF262 domain-containing protein [Adonisia turfae]NEZ63567.1 DUF262 domain-containing protein [Adonisia turfae CCMR0082]
MKNAQKPDHISLGVLLNWLKDGRFVIPDFQREFEWQPRDIRDLMRSIFLDYYIGSLLLWKGKTENFNTLSCESIYGHNGSDNRQHIVLDGQQRLTAIYYAFVAPNKPLPKRSNRCFYYVRIDRFMAKEYDEAFNYQFPSKHWLKIFDDTSAQFAMHVFPLSVVGAGGWDLPNWVQGYEKFWLEKKSEATTAGDSETAKVADLHVEDAREFGEHLRSLTEQYQVSYVELDEDLGLDKVCDIFTQINSKGVRLDVFDLINALLKPRNLQLKQMWRDASSRLEFVETGKMNVYILQVISILKQSYCSPKYLYFLLPGEAKPVRDPDGTRRKEVLIPNAEAFEKQWHHAVDTLEKAINLLRHPQEFGVTSSKYLPYVSILPVFAALQSYVKTLPAESRLHAQRKIRYWYWASVFTNRYSGSVESTSARDFISLKAWFNDGAAEPALIQEFKTRFKTLDLRREVNRGSSLYNGIFNLLVMQEARDWITGNIPQYGDLDDHHIVPVAWGNKHLKGKAIHSILNRTPLTAATNRHVIKERLPNAYLPELIKANGQEAVQAILESHFISPTAQAILLRDPFTSEDFEAFIAERQRTVQQAIENLLIKERLDLSPQLRELDERIEKVELGLRKLIDSVFEGDLSLVPPKVKDKSNERIQRALKKNAALNPDDYETLAARLEFFDLRELQDCMITKSLWPKFEPYFANKNALNGKFDQLAELRNSIRHSRAVNEIAQKEGEAAVIWFQTVLAK